MVREKICILHFFFLWLPVFSSAATNQNGKPKTKTKKIIKKQKTQVNTETDNGIHGFHNLWLSNIPGVVTNQWNDNCDLKLLETTQQDNLKKTLKKKTDHGLLLLR